MQVFLKKYFLHSSLKYERFLNRSIWPIDEPLTGTITQGQVNQGVIALKAYSTFPRSSELEPHHQMQLSVILGKLCWGYCQRILSPPTGRKFTRKHDNITWRIFRVEDLFFLIYTKFTSESLMRTSNKMFRHGEEINGY